MVAETKPLARLGPKSDPLRSPIVRSFLLMIAIILTIELIVFMVIFYRVDLPLNVFSAIIFVVADFWFWLVLAPGIIVLANRFPFTNISYAVFVHVPVGIVASMSALAVSTLSQKWVNRTGYDLFPDILHRWNIDTKLTFVFYLFVVFAIAAAKYQSQLDRARVDEAEAKARETQLQSDLKQMRLDTVNAKLQPHFLFNAMHTLSALLDKNTDLARDGLKRLSVLLRSALRASANDHQTLRDEVQWVENFLAFERLRFDLQVELQVDLEQDLANINTPSMVLQPFIENALKHAVPPVDGLRIDIRGTWVDSSRARIIVEDNGAGRGDVDIKPGTGIHLARERLAIAFPRDATIEINPACAGGLRVTIEFPASRSTGYIDET